MSKRFPRIGWIVMIAVLVVALGILPACGGGGGGGGAAIPYKNDGIFVQDTIGGIDSLDPAWAYDTASSEQIQYMYDTLLFFDGNGTDTFNPMLAVNWTVLNDTAIKFCVNTSVQFWNGDYLTAEDVAYSIWRAQVIDRAGGPAWMFNVPLTGHSRSRSGTTPRADWLQHVFNATVVDGDCVIFRFFDTFITPKTYPMLAWKQILCSSWASIVDMDWCIANGEWDPSYTANWTAYNNPAVRENTHLYNQCMGTGPWIGPSTGLVGQGSWTPGTSVILNRFNGYWRGPASFNQTITYFRDVWATRKLDLLNGNADLVYVPRNYISELLNITDVQKYFPLPDITIDTIFFNQNVSAESPYCGNQSLVGGNGIPLDFFSDPQVRKGFCYAFDYETYKTDVLQGEAIQLGGPLVQGLFGFNPSASQYSFCLTKARECLQNTVKWGNLSETGFTLTVVYNTGNDPRRIACEMLSENMLLVDPEFSIAVQAIPWDAYMPLVFTADRPNTVPLFQVGWLVDYPDPDDFIQPYMGTEGDFSYYQFYGNSTIDDMIIAARYMNNNATRQQIYYDLQEIYYQDAAGIVLFQTLGRRFFTKYVHGFYFNPAIPGLPGPLYDMYKSAT
jgi:peptide/nickel transport system substrate-binding protein